MTDKSNFLKPITQCHMQQLLIDHQDATLSTVRSCTLPTLLLHSFFPIERDWHIFTQIDKMKSHYSSGRLVKVLTETLLIKHKKISSITQNDQSINERKEETSIEVNWSLTGKQNPRLINEKIFSQKYLQIFCANQSPWPWNKVASCMQGIIMNNYRHHHISKCHVPW